MKKERIIRLLKIPFSASPLIAALLIKLFIPVYSPIAFALAAFSVVVIIGFLVGNFKDKGTVKLLSLILAGVTAFTSGVFTFTLLGIIKDAKTDSDPSADYLIVLGAGLDGVVPSVSLRERLDKTVWYLNEFPEATAIVSGGIGSGEDIAESEAMQIYLVNSGISDSRIMQEKLASNTHENIVFSIKLIESSINSDYTIAILSSEYHLHRAKLIAKTHFGITAKSVAAETEFLPLRINYYIREVLATIYSHLSSIFA